MPEDASLHPDRGSAQRTELPSDPWMLAPMGKDFGAALEESIAALGLTGGPAASEGARLSYEMHARLLREWGAVINLTAIREPAAVARRHVADSLSAVGPLGSLVRPGSTLLDLGSGTGYPGLPLAAALPLTRVGLLDSVGKKARFLGVAGAAVRRALAGADADADADAEGGIALRIEAIAERAEDLAEDPDERAAWDVVTARAVGSLAEVVELALPLARQDGIVVVWKREEPGDALRSELRDAGSIIRATGGGRPEVHVVEAPELAGHRLVIVPKVRPTPATYPRPAGVRRRRP